MTEWLQTTFQMTETEAKVAISLALVVALILVRIVLARLIARGVDDTDVQYRARKSVSYSIAVVAVLSLAWLWVGALQNVGTFLGLASAGLAIALSDVLRNIAGWMYIMLRRPYRVDDRIEVDGVLGDVIDIRMFRTTLLEIGNWVDADQSTGRIVHMPNGKVFTSHVFNSTEGFGYLWHEILLYVTFESDWHRAEQLLQAALEEAGGHTVEDATRRIHQASKYYKIRFTHLTPTVYISVRDRGVLLTGRILVDTRRRRAVDQQVWRRLLDDVKAAPAVEFAYPTTRAHLRDPLRIDDGARTPTGQGVAGHDDVEVPPSAR